MKQCAICSKSIEHLEDPAILFIGRYGHRYELCPECETITERFIAPESEEERKEAADILYDRIFNVNTDRKSAEMLDYIKSLFAENSETLAEAENALREYREEEAQKDESEREEEEAETLPAPDAEEHEISEEEFLADTAKKTPLGVKLAFLFLFLAIGGGAIAYGIFRSSTFTIVAGAMIALLGLASVFSKD